MFIIQILCTQTSKNSQLMTIGFYKNDKWYKKVLTTYPNCDFTHSQSNL